MNATEGRRAHEEGERLASSRFSSPGRKRSEATPAREPAALEAAGPTRPFCPLLAPGARGRAPAGRGGAESSGAPGSPISWAEQRRATSGRSGEARRAGPLRPLTGRRRAAPSSPARLAPLGAASLFGRGCFRGRQHPTRGRRAGPARRLPALPGRLAPPRRLGLYVAVLRRPSALLCIRTPSSTCRRQVLLKRGRRKRQAGRNADRRGQSPT